jgi:hypothetical protein
MNGTTTAVMLEANGMMSSGPFKRCQTALSSRPDSVPRYPVLPDYGDSAMVVELGNRQDRGGAPVAQFSDLSFAEISTTSAFTFSAISRLSFCSCANHVTSVILCSNVFRLPLA